MAGNRFVIPTYNPDFIGASQAAQARNYQKYRDSYGDLINAFNSLGAVGRDYSNRKFAEEQAEKQRQFQAEEAAKARQFQAEQHAQDLAAQAAWNNQVRSQEEAKLAASEKAVAQERYANLMAGEDTPATRLMISQIRNKYPDIDQYETGEVLPTPFINAGQPAKRSIYEDTLAKRQEDADLAKKVALYRAGIPTQFADDAAVKAQIEDINKQGFGDKYTTGLVDYVNGIKTRAAQAADAYANAGLNFGTGQYQTQLQKQQGLKDALAQGGKTKEQRAILKEFGYHWDSKTRKWVQ